MDHAADIVMNTGSCAAPGATRRPVRILAVIDALDPSSADSNERIVTRAAALAKRLDGELHVASAYAMAATNAQPYRIERYLPALRVKARDRRRCAIRQLLHRLHITDAAIHVEAGALQQVVDSLAAALQAAVVVGKDTEPLLLPRKPSSSPTVRTGLPVCDTVANEVAA